MPAAKSSSFVDGLLQSQLLDAEQSEELQRLNAAMPDSRALAQELLRRDWLTAFQVNQIFQGNARDLVLGPFILLERIGEGGMGQVFKAKQKLLNRTVALKVISRLPGGCTVTSRRAPTLASPFRRRINGFQSG